MDKPLPDSSDTKQQVSGSIPRKLYRLPKQGKIAGVCAGIAEYLETDVTVIRVVFIVLTLASGGFGILVYIALALIMPVADGRPVPHDAKDLSENFSNLSAELRENGGADRLRNYAGGALVFLGAWLLLSQFFPAWIYLNWRYVWPVLLVLIGLFLLTKGRK